MTAPRDPIEAPATLATMKPEDEWADKFYAALSDLWLALKGTEIPAMGAPPHLVMADLIQSVAAARDEGRQEAVRLLDDAERVVSNLLSWADRYRNADPALHPDEWYIARDDGKRFLDDVARHGRSSDPEPAPPEDERLPFRDELTEAEHEVAARLHTYLWGKTPHEDEPADGSDCQICWDETNGLFFGTIAPAVEAAYRRAAVPALQATGEATDECGVKSVHNSKLICRLPSWHVGTHQFWSGEQQ